MSIELLEIVVEPEEDVIFEQLNPAGRAQGAVAGAPDVATALARWEAEYERDPKGTAKPGVCWKCGASMGLEPSDYIEVLAFGGALCFTLCNDCIEKRIAEIKAEERKARDDKFARVIPVEFIGWDEGKGNRTLLERVSQLYPDPDGDAGAQPRGNFALRRGAVLHGPTGSCKTRVTWQIVKRLLKHADPQSWCFMDASDMAAHGPSVDSFTASWLVIDDLGNEPTSSKHESALLRLIRSRCDWHRPTIITTQLTGAAFKKRFFEAAPAAAILRRLMERSDDVPT